MFEYLLPDGTALPENEVIKLAVQKGLTPDDYVKKNKLTLRPKQKKKSEVKKEVAKPVVKNKPTEETSIFDSVINSISGLISDDEDYIPIKKPVRQTIAPIVKTKENKIDTAPTKGFSAKDFYTDEQLSNEKLAKDIEFDQEENQYKTKKYNYTLIKDIIKKGEDPFNTNILPIPATTDQESQTRTLDYANSLLSGKADETDPTDPLYDSRQRNASMFNTSKTYVDKYQSVMGATGDYSWMKDYTPTQKIDYLSNDLTGPSYALEVYDPETKKTSLVGKKGYVLDLQKSLPQDISSFKTQMDLDKAIATSSQKYFNNDPAYLLQKKIAVEKTKPLLKQKHDEILKKYDLSNPANVAKANKEYTDFYSDAVYKQLNDSKVYKNLVKQFDAVMKTAQSELDVKFGRYNDTFLKAVDSGMTIGDAMQKMGGISKPIGAALKYGAMGIESVAKGSLALVDASKKTGISLDHGDVIKLNDFYNKYKNKGDNEKFDLPETWNDVMAKAEGIGQAESLFGKDIPKTYGEARKRIKEGIGRINTDIESSVANIAKSQEYTNLFNKADLSNGIEVADIVRLVGEQAPNLAITTAGAVTGNPLVLALGSASMFTQEYGEQYYGAIVTGLKQDLGRTPTNKEIASAISKGEYANRAEAAAFSAISAGLEFASEINIIRNTGKALGIAKGASGTLGSLFKGEIKAFGKSMLEKGSNIAESGLGEYITEALQQGVGQVSKGVQLDKEDPFRYMNLKEMEEAGKAGGIIGAIIPFAGTVASQSALELRNSARSVATTFDLGGPFEKFKEADGFFKAAEQNINSKFEAGELDEKQKNEELAALSNIRNTGLKMPSNFDAESRQKSFDLIIEKNKLAAEIEGKEPSLVTPQKDRIKQIDTQLSEISVEQYIIKEGTKRLAKNISAAEKIASRTGKTTFENGIGSGKSLETFETEKEAQAAVDKWHSENNLPTVSLKNSPGFMLDNGQIVINKEVAAKTFNVNVAGHELLHKILISEFNNANPERAAKLKEQFWNTLSENEKTLVNDRILAKDENGVRLYDDQYLKDNPDEYLTQFFEVVASRKLTWSEKLEDMFAKIGDILLGQFKKQGFPNLEFENGKDVYDFIKDYNKNLRRGKISERAAALGEKGKEITSNKKYSKVADLKQELADLEVEYDEGYGDMEAADYKNQKSNIEIKLRIEIKKEAENVPKVEKPKKEVSEESTVKEIIKENKGKISSDKVQEIYDKKGTEGALEIIKLFKPITGRIVDKRRDAPGFSESDLTYEIENGKGGILDLIMKYDPSEGVPLAAYINKYLPVRAITASRRILDKEFTSDVSEEVNVAATETADQNMTERTVEKPKYKDAIESNILEPNILETAVNKIISTVRLLKSRIDAPITLNRTVTPLIAEIRDEMGKQLDIDIKTMLGGKKDGVLRKELLKAKRYILENMTTTWLMGKDGQGGIPQAIQKRIDSKWVNFPNWVGQKIDREAMSTDLAGRTSGAELVRRLPNVFNNVSNEEFLAQIIGPDGNPIRGRKESVSKAMAEEIAFDVILNDFKLQGPIFQVFAANQERLGVEINDVLTTTFTNQVERGNVKFSKAGTTNSMLFLLKENQWDFNSPELVAFYKSLSPKDKVNYADFKKTWKKKVTNLPEEYKRVWESNEGVKFEAETYKKLRNFSKNNPEFILNERIPDKFNSKNPDLVYRIGEDGRNIIVELKADKNAPHGSTSNINILGKNITLTRGFDGDTDFKKAMLNSEIRKATLDYLIKNNISKNPNSLIVTKEVWDNVKKEKNGPSKPITSKALGQINAGKDIIHIQGSGSFAYDGRNVGQLSNVPEIDGNMYVYSRITSTSAGKNSENRRVIERLFFQLGNDWDQKSDYDIVNDPSKFVKDATKFSKSEPLITSEYREEAAQNNTNINAVSTSLKLFKTPKGISVFDFDDTVGLTKGSVLYTMPDGSKGKLNAEEFAKDGSILLENGAEFDFSEFSKVVGGKPGPMVEKMKKMIGKFGPDNFFILTARPANAAGPIHEFLSSIGIDIPLENITGLGNSTAQAKADWMTGKAAEGYNDFYFSDDATQNVKAVKDALAVLDVKSKIQQARLKFSKTINLEFNKILEENVGVKVDEKFSDIVAKRKGAAIGKYRFFVPPSAADLELLTYDFLGYGKTGEEQQRFFNQALFEPYANGIALIDAAKQSIKNDYKALLKAFPEVSKDLGKLTPDGTFTYDQALRVSMWAGMGEEIPGLLKEDITKLNDFVNQDTQLSAFKAGLIATGRQGTGWVTPTEYWDSETIISDLHNITDKVGRKKYLGEFIENSQEMFSKENLNKIETIYGSNFRDALEDIIYRMSNGTNRESGPGRINAAWLNWINNSTGAIMFWNTRSAVLQTIGAINYLNWRDNNPLNAAKAFANQPQYWKDFAYIWNSDKMKERRSGLKEDVSSAEIANAAAGTTSKANAIISYLLKKGFLPTQIGDSFAIASGGAAFYRNRINYNLKQGMTQEEAEANAWKEFLKVTDQTQQSGDPRDVSQQQASVAGRLVLAFQNTSMQQARLVKKAGLDLINNRGDAKTNISKIVYYTAVQNIIFGSLQSALFATIFSDDDDEEKKKKKQTTKDKWLDIGNNIVDTILRGSGLAGAVVATLKNVYLKYNDESEKGFKADYAKVLIEAANVAPPLGSKFTKAYGAMRTVAFEKDVIAKRGWSVSANGRLNLSPAYTALGQGVEAATNLPMNRFVTKVNNISEAMDSRNKSWQRIALAVGYNPYVIGAKNEENDIIKAEAKIIRKQEGRKKSAETRRRKKLIYESLSYTEQAKIDEQKELEREKRKEEKERLGY